MRGQGVVGSGSRRQKTLQRRPVFRAGESAARGRRKSPRATRASYVTSARRIRRDNLPPPPRHRTAGGRRRDGCRCAGGRLRARTTYVSDHSSARSDAQGHYLAWVWRISLICVIRSRHRVFSVPADSGVAPSLNLNSPFHFLVHAGARDAVTMVAPRSNTLPARVEAV